MSPPIFPGDTQPRVLQAARPHRDTTDAGYFKGAKFTIPHYLRRIGTEAGYFKLPAPHRDTTDAGYFNSAKFTIPH